MIDATYLKTHRTASSLGAIMAGAWTSGHYHWQHEPCWYAAFAEDLCDVVMAIRNEGHTTLRVLTERLNARGIRTRRGGRWHVSTVRNLLRRMQSAPTTGPIA